jgi:internalin A
MPVRIYDISKKLGLESKEILAKAKQLGIPAAKVPSSNLDKITAAYLEEEILKDHPDIAARPPPPQMPPPALIIGERVGFVQLPTRPAHLKEQIRPAPPPPPPPPPTVRISEVAKRVGLPIDQVQAIVKEFSLPFGSTPDSLYEDTAQDLARLVQSGKVVEKRLSELEKGGRSLDLRGFPLRDEWTSRISRCKHIQELNLSNTGLSTLPDAFAELNELSLLDLSGNSLEQLPQWLLDLPKLGAIYLHGNSALNLPTEILGAASKEADPAKPRDILEYYFRLQSGGKRPLNEAKLILLGRGEVGKTCLVNRLVHNQFTDTAMTCGISITHWKVKMGKEGIRLHVWDFGGQEIQHATHQFFLTERSLYLVVLNGRAGAEDDDAEYWLKFVKTFGGCSPTIVVLNKFKVQPFEVDEAGLKEKYPFIREFVETDCEADIGIVDLRKNIETALTTMEHIRVSFPAEWFQIKENLSEMQEPFISFQRYRALCASKNEKDSEAQETLAVFLNALGIALNFRQDARLREETVLNPHWLTKGVYRIITSQMLAESKGELWLSSLGGILPQDEYPPQMHLFLIELMRKFELCFPYHDDPVSHRYLVPELLGKKQPTFNETFLAENCVNYRYDYRILPEGLLPRFITRTHVMSNPMERWRSGVVLRWESSRALVKADKQERQVIVRVTGDRENRRRLLAVIRENFDHIHSEMKEFRPTEWIALEDNPDEWVNQRDLETFHKQNVEEVPKAVGSQVFSVNVARVLSASDVVDTRPFVSTDEEAKRAPVKTFLSYAHADERWRAKIAPNFNILQRAGLVKIWCDLEIKPGHIWDDEIKHKLEEAELYVFLVSAALLDSDYVLTVELPIAQRRFKANEARVIPIIIRDCSWKRYFGDVQALPTGGRPVKKWPDRDSAFHDVEKGIERTILEMRELASAGSK